MMRRLIITVVALLFAAAAHAGQVSHPVQGPPTTVLNHFACWNNLTGSLLKDCTGGGGGGASSAGPLNDIQTSDGAGGFLSFTPGAGIQTFLTVPSSANLLSGLTTKTGTGLVVFGTGPTLVGPTLSGTSSILGGANVTSLTQSTGNITVDCGTRPAQYIANTGAFTVTAPANDGYCYLDVENGASAGAVSVSGFAPNSIGGASLDTTNGHNFRLYISRVHGHATVDAKALQ
jgi:hypothetical protein